MTTVLTPDLCIIGGGMAGSALAEAAALLGVPVVLVEREAIGAARRHGETAVRALAEAARQAQAVRDARGFGVNASLTKVDFNAVRRHVARAVDAATRGMTAARLRGLGVNVIEASARFADRRTVEAGSFTIQARRFVIATGARSVLPDVPGLGDVPCLTPDSVFDLDERPEHLLVLAGEPRALELAQAFRRLGSKVSVVEVADPLAGEDPEMAETVRTALLREGLALRAATVEGVEAAGRGVRLALRGEAGPATLSGSHLLAATGRAAVTDGLGLDAARIRQDGAVLVLKRHFKTGNARVYAIGGAAGAASEGEALYQAERVLRHAVFRLSAGSPGRRDAVPRVLWTGPELAHVGLTEDEARARLKRIRVLRAPQAGNGAAQAMRAPDGHVKIVACGRGRIHGVTIVGAHAGERIAAWCGLVGRRAHLSEAAAAAMPHPALADAGRRAALGGLVPGLTRPGLGRIIRFLRNFG